MDDKTKDALQKIDNVTSSLTNNQTEVYQKLAQYEKDKLKELEKVKTPSTELSQTVPSPAKPPCCNKATILIADD